MELLHSAAFQKVITTKFSKKFFSVFDSKIDVLSCV